MGFRDKYKKQKSNLRKRHEESISRTSESQYGSIFLRDKIPENITFWKPNKAQHIVDFIPFFAGEQHPAEKKGDISYVIDIWVHTNVGPTNDQYVCPAYTYKKPCPICEYMGRGRLPKDEYNAVRPKRRCVYLIWSHDTPQEEQEGVKLWEVAHWYMQEKIDEIAKSPRGGGAVPFSDPDIGRSIVFTIKSTGKYEIGGVERESIGYVGHKFDDRNEAIPDKILEQTFSVDGCIKMKPSYNEIYKSFNGKDPVNKSEDIEDDVPNYEPEEENNAEEETIGDESPFIEGECPFGGTFGLDCQSIDECSNCDLWDNCYEQKEEMEGAKGEEKKEPKPEPKTKPKTKPASKPTIRKRLSRRGKNK